MGPGGHRPAALHLARRPLDLGFRNPFQTTTTLDAPNVNGYTIDFRNSRGQPTITYPFDVTSAGPAAGRSSARRRASRRRNITPSEIRIRPQGADNSFTTFRGDVAWDVVPDRITLKAGGFYREYDFSTFEFRRVNQTDTILALPAGTTLVRGHHPADRLQQRRRQSRAG